MESYSHVVRHVEAMPSGSSIGAFFDFDGTVINGYSAFIFLREQLRKGYMKPIEFVEIVATLINHSMGAIGFSGLMDVGAKVLRGVSEESYTEFSEKVYEHYISKLLYPEARALIEAHHKKGHTVAIVSSATPYQVEPLARELNIDHVYCSRYDVKNGVFTGETLKPLCWGHGKVEAVETLAKKYQLDLDNSCFYSDSDDDIEVLHHVGMPRIVNPNSRLQTIASENGWPVQVFARTGKPTLAENLRSVGLYGTLISSYFWGLGVWKLNGSKDEGRRFMLSLFTEIAFALIGLKLNVRNPENYWKERPVVVVYNHQSKTDGLIVMKLLRDNFAAVGKKEIGKFKLFAKVYDFAGVVTVDRQNTQSAIDAMRPLVDALAVEGRNVAIAPEGTRSETKKPGPFKKGAFHIAMQAGVPILPVVIHNAADIQPKGQFAFRPGVVDVEILPPVDTSGWTEANLDRHVTDVRNMFLKALDFPEEGVAESVHSRKTQKMEKAPGKRAVTKKSAAKKPATASSVAKKVSTTAKAAVAKPSAPKGRGREAAPQKSAKSKAAGTKIAVAKETQPKRKTVTNGRLNTSLPGRVGTEKSAPKPRPKPERKPLAVAKKPLTGKTAVKKTAAKVV
jgi:putative phosphoserine phosphatase/1-acylglycerol-3-phosphate O-acyltransferase